MSIRKYLVERGIQEDTIKKMEAEKVKTLIDLNIDEVIS
jgi:hypothetical protein